MLISNPSHCTRMEIWTPKYSSKYGEAGEWVALLAQYKVHRASPIIIVDFPKAKHLQGQRFAIRRRDVEKCDLGSNGRIAVYEVPMSMFEGWDTPEEVREIALNLFDN